MGWRRYRARNLRKELKLAAAKVAAQERERAAAVLSRPTQGQRLCLHCEYFLESLAKCCFLVSLTCDCVLVPCVRVPAPPVGEYVYPRKPREVTLTKSRVTSFGQNGHFPH